MRKGLSPPGDLMLVRLPFVMEAPILAYHDPEIVSRVRHIEMVPRS